MKVEVEDLSSVKRKIHVQLPAEVVAEAFDEAYEELRKTARLKGFRPGKVPRSLLERYYGDKVRYEVTTKLVQETYTKSLKEKALKPVSQPDFADLEIRSGEDFRYTATVEVKPEVEVSDYIGLDVKLDEVKVTHKDIKARLEEIREMFARLEDVTEDRPVHEGDVVLADHRWFVGGEPLGNGVPQEEMLEVRRESVGDDLFKALIGLRPGGEATIPRKFSADHPDPKVAGKQGELHLTVKNIRRKILPDLDDSLARRLGEYATLEHLKIKVREELDEAGRQRRISEMNEMLIEQLLKRHPIEVPETLVEQEIQRMIRNTQQRLAAHGLTIERSGSTPEAMRVRYRDSAERLVRTGAILESIARLEGIRVEDQDLSGAYQRIANQTGRDLKAVMGLYEDTVAAEALKETLLQEKTLDFLRDKANIVKKGRAVRKRKG